MPSSFEDAKHCPKCNEPGEEQKLTDPPPDAKLPKGTKLVHIFCRNARCKWFNTSWLVQINPDGTVPDPVDHRTTPKQYVGFDDHNSRAAQLISSLKEQAKAETKPGAEYRGPR